MDCIAACRVLSLIQFSVLVWQDVGEAWEASWILLQQAGDWQREHACWLRGLHPSRFRTSASCHCHPESSLWSCCESYIGREEGKKKRDFDELPLHDCKTTSLWCIIKGIYHPTASCDCWIHRTVKSWSMSNLIGPLYNLQTFKRKYTDITRMRPLDGTFKGLPFWGFYYHKVREYFVYRDDHGLGSMAIHLAHHCFSFNMRSIWDLTPSHDSAHQNTPLAQKSCKFVHGKVVKQKMPILP